MTDDTSGQHQHGDGGGRGDDAAQSHLDSALLSAYLDNQLGVDERRAAAAHLATCDACRRDLADLQTTVLLLNRLPDFRPRRSFQLGPEHDRRTASSGSWLTRLLPALPALRAATVAAVLLLVAVVTGDIITRDDETNRSPAIAVATQEPSARQAEQPTLEAGAAAPTDQVAPAGAQTDTLAPTPTSAEARAAPPQEEEPAADDFVAAEDDESEAAAGSAGGDAADGDAADSNESLSESAQSDTATDDDDLGEADEESSADQTGGEAGMAAPAAAQPQPTPTVADVAAFQAVSDAATSASPSASAAASPVASPALMPTATREAGEAITTPAASASAGPDDNDDGDQVSTWRLAEVGLALLVAWLVVSLVGLERLRRR